MSILLAFLLALMPLQSGSLEELYEAYATPETRAILERQEQAAREAEAAQAASQAQKTLILVISLAIGLIPPVTIGWQAIKQKSWKNNPGGTARGLAISLLGGALLFGLNYGILMLKLKMGDAFNTTLAFLLVAGIIVGAIWLLTKKDKKA